MELQLVGSHVGHGLGVGGRAGESAVDALVQGGQLVEHPVHHGLPAGKEAAVSSAEGQGFLR